MQVTINGKRIDVFNGASVQDALRTFSQSEWAEVAAGRKKITDARGREVMLGGALRGGESLQVCDREETK